MNRANLFVLSKQHLTSDSDDGEICQIVNNVGGLHATGSTTPYLSLHARCCQFVKEDLDVELYSKRTPGKVRCVRKTIYIHTKDRIPIVWKATAGQVLRASKGFMASRGVTDEVYGKLSQDILQMLRGREMTAAEIKATLKTDSDVSSILYFMCDHGLLIRGRPVKGWKDRSHQYGLFNDYFPDINLEGLNANEAIITLVKLYLASFGPAREADAAWWTGLGKTKVQWALKELEDQLVEVSIPEIGEGFIMLQSDRKRMEAFKLPREPVINLLPSLDPYLMGYKERERYLAQENYSLVYDRSGNATSTIMVDGRVVGVWDFEGGGEPLVKIFLFRELGKPLRDEIFTKAEYLGEFISDMEVRVMECASMIPLSERTAGSFMSPLKGSTDLYSHAKN
ncbi:MAG TPA: winged helix DNA-binding domain-containing protein [Anaerolineae bacterium]|nr:winged helix DNA-binding domain-containing protein [Anaerolineae bacterium]